MAFETTTLMNIKTADYLKDLIRKDFDAIDDTIDLIIKAPVLISHARNLGFDELANDMVNDTNHELQP